MRDIEFFQALVLISKDYLIKQYTSKPYCIKIKKKKQMILYLVGEGGALWDVFQ